MGIKAQTTGTALLPFDELDMRLIAELQRDGRQSFTGLGEKLGVSHGTIRNRLERLLAEQVIRITAVVDPARLGFRTHVLIGISADMKHGRTIERELAAIEEAWFVATTTGRVDFLITAAFRSDVDLHKFLLERLAGINGIRGTETSHILRLGKRVWQWGIPSHDSDD